MGINIYVKDIVRTNVLFKRLSELILVKDRLNEIKNNLDRYSKL